MGPHCLLGLRSAFLQLLFYLRDLGLHSGGFGLRGILLGSFDGEVCLKLPAELQQSLGVVGHGSLHPGHGLDHRSGGGAADIQIAQIRIADTLAIAHSLQNTSLAVGYTRRIACRHEAVGRRRGHALTVGLRLLLYRGGLFRRCGLFCSGSLLYRAADFLRRAGLLLSVRVLSALRRCRGLLLVISRSEPCCFCLFDSDSESAIFRSSNGLNALVAGRIQLSGSVHRPFCGAPCLPRSRGPPAQCHSY